MARRSGPASASAGTWKRKSTLQRASSGAVHLAGVEGEVGQVQHVPGGHFQCHRRAAPLDLLVGAHVHVLAARRVHQSPAMAARHHPDAAVGHGGVDQRHPHGHDMRRLGVADPFALCRLVVVVAVLVPRKGGDLRLRDLGPDVQSAQLTHLRAQDRAQHPYDAGMAIQVEIRLVERVPDPAARRAVHRGADRREAPRERFILEQRVDFALGVHLARIFVDLAGQKLAHRVELGGAQHGALDQVAVALVGGANCSIVTHGCHHTSPAAL